MFFYVFLGKRIKFLYFMESDKSSHRPFDFILLNLYILWFFNEQNIFLIGLYVFFLSLLEEIILTIGGKRINRVTYACIGRKVIYFCL